MNEEKEKERRVEEVETVEQEVRMIRKNKVRKALKKSILVLNLKNKVNVQICRNYRRIKPTSQTMKIWERAVEGKKR